MRNSGSQTWYETKLKVGLLRRAQIKKEKMKSALWKFNKWIKGRKLLKAVCGILIFTPSTKWMQMCLSSNTSNTGIYRLSIIAVTLPLQLWGFFSLILGQRADWFPNSFICRSVCLTGAHLSWLCLGLCTNSLCALAPSKMKIIHLKSVAALIF